MTQFWGQYQWQLIQQVLRIDANHHPADAFAGARGGGIVWFGHALADFLALSKLYLVSRLSRLCKMIIIRCMIFLMTIYDTQHQSIPEHRLWRICEEGVVSFVRYLTHRPEWLHAWTHDLPLPESIDEMIDTKDRFANDYSDGDPTPKWLIQQYHDLEKLLRYLWRQLFSEVYAYH